MGRACLTFLTLVTRVSFKNFPTSHFCHFGLSGKSAKVGAIEVHKKHQSRPKPRNMAQWKRSWILWPDEREFKPHAGALFASKKWTLLVTLCVVLSTKFASHNLHDVANGFVFFVFTLRGLDACFTSLVFFAKTWLI